MLASLLPMMLGGRLLSRTKDHWKLISMLRTSPHRWSRVPSQKFLRPDQAVPYLDSIRAVNHARKTIVAVHPADFSGQKHKILACLLEVATKIVVGQVTQLIGNRHASGAFPFTLITHAAV